MLILEKKHGIKQYPDTQTGMKISGYRKCLFVVAISISALAGKTDDGCKIYFH
jgi:hypothetical protein